MDSHQLQPYRSAPVEQGETLVAFDRNGGQERLRVSLEAFNGFGFVRLQCWSLNRQGEWWPTKGRCVTVKLRECEDLSEVLADVARGRPGHRREANRPLQRSLPGPVAGQPEAAPPFDEFGNDG